MRSSDIPQSDAAEAALRNEERRRREDQLRDLERVGGVGSWRWDLAADEVTWSDELYRIFGLELEEPIDFERFRSLIHPEDRDLVLNTVDRALETREPYMVEHRICRSDGSVRWVLGKGAVIPDRAGQAVRVVGTAQDITERKEFEERERELARERAAREAAEHAEERMRILAEASAVLASSLEYETTLANVARLSVPGIADWCAVDIVDEDGSLERLAVEHSDPAKIGAVREIERRYPPDPESDLGAPGVVRTGRSQIGPEIPDSLLVESAVDEEHLRMLRSLGLRSYIVAPLAGRDHVLGAITLVYAESGRRYTEDDLPFVEDLARRAATAIENARLVKERDEAQRRLENQAAELEQQAEELEHQAVHLEEAQAELEVSNAELQHANEELLRYAQAALRDRSEKAALLESVSEGIYGIDHEGRCTFMNRAAAELLGYEPEELLGRSFHEAVHHSRADGSPYPREECPILQAMAGREAIRIEDDVLWRKDGTSLPVAHASAPIRGNNGVSGAVVTFHDITERKQAALAREEEARLVETLYKVGHSLTAELDLEHIVQEVTDAATQLTGAQFGAFFYNVLSEKGESYMLYTISGVPREAFARFPMPRNTPIFAPTFTGEAVVRSDDITKDQRYGQLPPYHGMPPGHLPVASYLAVPVHSRSGEVLGGLFFGHSDTGCFKERHERLALGIAGWAAVAMDNARLFEAERAARAEAERANRAKSDFLATMSHELRTPLNAMIGYTDLLLAGVPTEIPPEPRQKVERIGISARHLLGLIEEILTFSRLEAGEEKLDIEEVELSALLREVQALSEPLALAKGISFGIRSPDAPRRMQSDSRKIRQILINLIGNAVKFTSEGEVVLSVEEVGHQVVFEVRDTGSGISEEYLEKIFDPFWQVQGGTTRSTGGTGLGLSVTRRLARLLGGDVEARSVPGEGSTFTVRLPVRAPAPTASFGEREWGERSDGG